MLSATNREKELELKLLKITSDDRAGEHWILEQITKCIDEWKQDANSATAVLVNAHDENGMSALHYMSIHGYISCMTKLLQEGADVDSRDRAGRTPLHLVSTPEALSLLLEHKPNINAKTYLAGQTPIMFPVSYSKYSKILEVFLTKKPELNIQDEDGETALFYAVKVKSLSGIRQLLAAGADFTLRNKSQHTALDVLIADSGVNFDYVDRDKENIIEIENYIECIRALLVKGATFSFFDPAFFNFILIESKINLDALFCFENLIHYRDSLKEANTSGVEAKPSSSSLGSSREVFFSGSGDRVSEDADCREKTQQSDAKNNNSFQHR